MKTVKKNARYFKYLFLFGPLLVIAGVTAGIVSGAWSGVPLAILIAGFVIMGLWLLVISGTKGFWGRRSTQAGTNAMIATLSMLVILGLINFLSVRYGTRVDLTENQLLSLAPQSQQVVRNLEQPVKVWVFDPNPDLSDRELLENYRRYSPNLEFQFVDPQVQLSLAEKFKVQSPREVYLEYGAERQLLQSLSDTERLSEVRLTNAIERLTSDRIDTAYFLQGHGERPLELVEGGLAQAISRVEEKNFIPQPLNLADRAAVPEDASLVIVAGPKRPLFEGEVRALRDYLATGGSLLLMIDPDTNPELDSLLEDWGVEIDNRIVIDASGQGRVVGLGPATPLVTNYGDHPITQDFGNGISFYPLAQPVLTTPVDGVRETPLLLTNEQSWAESTPETQPLEFNEEEGDRIGPLVLGVALSRQTNTLSASPSPSPEASPSPDATSQTEQKSSESRLVVIGNSNFATNNLFEQQLNGDVFLNSVSWLGQRDEQALSLRPREQTNRRINLSPVQGSALAWISLLLVPLLGFTTAGVIWWRRR
ncbi:MAG: Gldg family protein [Kastovskya adunca ATA6-11-RM4]|jgi:ABC-type uncharacterized transport system involved in gliding motility auxiliary subunit|nr:Gldg family protein [Kastovskya adunca ATA6-11-RM4]